MHADDTLVRVHGRYLIFWGLLDSETRFLIALHISQKRGSKEAQTLLKKGLKAVKNKPQEIITDGLPSYSKAIDECKAEFNQKLIHLQGPLTTPLNNNKMERFYGTLKRRIKVMPHFNGKCGAETFAKGFAIHYNFIKPHQALNWKTPAQEAGVASGKNNWLDLIINALKRAK